jgi:broad specificity phosphatase PhoE
VLLSSDLTRAVETATVLGRVLRLPHRVEPALREQALGSLEGRLTRSLAQPPAPPPSAPEPPDEPVWHVRWGGPSSESVADVHARVGAFLRDLLLRPPGSSIALVSHGDTIRVMLAWLRGGSPVDVEWCEVPNGSVTSVEVDRH